MSIAVTCPGCRAALRFARPLPAGAVARCPKCRGVVPVPAAADTSDTGATPDTDRTILAAPSVVSTPPPLPAHPARLGPYRVLEPLGVGGMGRVYRAEDPLLRRHVALKVMLPHLAADPAAKARFLREARAQAQVEHDHVVAIHQIGEDGGVPFIAMPLLKGETLADALAGPRPPLAEVVRIGREVAEGLAAAHDRGLVHRDIKPSNVWLEGARRRVKILDFGLARVGGAADARPRDPTAVEADTGMTAQGAVVGTPLYMSPEQARGEAVDFRTDLFSLGVVLYQMATGSLPFGGATTEQILGAVETHDPPSAGEVNPDVPPALSILIARLLAKNPADRPASAADVAAELDRIAAPGGLPAVAADDPWARLADDAPSESLPSLARAPRKQSGPALLVGLVAGLVALVLGVVLLVRAVSPVGVIAVEGEEAELVVKRDGAEVLHTRGRSIRLPAADGYTVELADPKPGQSVDPTRVSLAAGGRVAVWVTTNTPRQLAPPRPPGPAVPTLTGDGEPLALVPKGDGWFALSPDGATLAVPVAGESNEVWLIDAHTGEVRHKLGGFSQRPFRSAFSPDGSLVAAAGLDATVRVWMVTTGELVRRLDHDNGALSVAFDPKGTSLAAAGHTSVRVWDTDTWAVRFTVAGQSAHAHGLAYSPDGSALAVATQDGVARLLDPTTGRVRSTFEKTHQLIGLAFRPDGKQLACGSDNHLLVWSVSSGRIVYQKDGVSGAWQQFSADGRELWAGPWGYQRPADEPGADVTRWDGSGKELGTVAVPPVRGFVSFVLSPGRSVLYAASQREIWACDARSGRPLPKSVP